MTPSLGQRDGVPGGAVKPAQPGSFQPSQSQTARPMTSSRSRPLSHGISSVNIVTHCFHEHGMRVMSVPQKLRSGPKASTICCVYLWMLR